MGSAPPDDHQGETFRFPSLNATYCACAKTGTTSRTFFLAQELNLPRSVVISVAALALMFLRDTFAASSTLRGVTTMAKTTRSTRQSR